MKRHIYIGGLLALTGLLGACSSDEEPIQDKPNTYTFEVRTRGVGATTPSAPDDARQHTRLYVAERLPEHTEPLHCASGNRHDLTGGHYELASLYGQWYKFAFVCVPKWGSGVGDDTLGGAELLTEEMPADHTCDFNKLLIDYKPVLNHQKSNPVMAATEDLNVYRKVIDRWIDPEPEKQPNVENVLMQRITGELIIEMGVPADQFPKDVEYIELTLKAPAMQTYVHDEAGGKVITRDGFGDMVYKLDFSGLEAEAYRTAMDTKQMFHLCLLPEVLQGTIMVKYKGTSESLALTLDADTANGNTRVEIHPNRRTTVLYHGMKPDEFEVRYAGFDDDAQIGVGDDEWNGWKPEKK